MTQALHGWLMLICAALVAAESRDTVLRFLSQKEMKAQKVMTMEKLQAKNTICPNKITECSDTSTCCPLPNGQYGCCSGVNAVCCSDGIHCCPQGFVCDMVHGQCSSTALGISFDWEDKVLQAHPVVRPEVGLTCQDNKTICQTNDTCCSSTSGFRCCPLPRAVCCLDKQHCCPANTQCDLVHKRCFRAEDNWYQPMVKRRQVEQRMKSIVSPSYEWATAKSNGVVCPDGQMCSDGQTCCQLSDGSYGCCPYSDATCCSDHVHCCPSGYTCNYTVHGCVQKLLTLVRSEDTQDGITPAVSSQLTMVVCPGGTSQCPDGSTCCKQPAGNWGCCPLPHAVCCSDHLHCCPQGYTCNVEAGQCDQPEGASVPWEEKKPATLRSVKSVICPGGEEECPDGSTCCQLSSGKWGCCPYPKAVCCSDHLHCCPQGYTCDAAVGQCNRPDGASVPWKEKKPATLRSVKSVICPGGAQECPVDTTCCKLTSGKWGCCPYPKAVCCSDHIHCCPNGFTCDVQTSSCKKQSGISLPWGEKKPATLSKSKGVICPDGQSECADGQTCCKTTQGNYGCCPEPSAVCCSDMIHCCPHGYKCNLAAKSCDHALSSVSMFTKVPAVTSKSNGVICPDGKSECAEGQTCCKNAQGSYSCCPDPRAVCCSDKLHCCPEGYTCNMVTKTCDKHSSLLVTQTAVAEESKMVPCPGGKSMCRTGQTCCKVSTSEYGCCPYSNAVCCADHDHCCPYGSECMPPARCLPKFYLPWEKKRPAIQRSP